MVSEIDILISILDIEMPKETSRIYFELFFQEQP